MNRKFKIVMFGVLAVLVAAIAREVVFNSLGWPSPALNTWFRILNQNPNREVSKSVHNEQILLDYPEAVFVGQSFEIKLNSFGKACSKSWTSSTIYTSVTGVLTYWIKCPFQNVDKTFEINVIDPIHVDTSDMVNNYALFISGGKVKTVEIWTTTCEQPFYNGHETIVALVENSPTHFFITDTLTGLNEMEGYNLKDGDVVVIWIENELEKRALNITHCDGKNYFEN